MAKYLTACCIGLIIGIVATLWIQALHKRAEELKEETAVIKWRQDHFILSEDNLRHELTAQGVLFPDIVLAQAILETGHFKSYVCTNNNNLFGLRKKDSTYMSFGHWTECVAAYKKYIQKWEEPPNDYYEYLDKLGYAEDSLYIKKLKQIK